MNENSKDKLSDFFRSRLKDPSAEESHWNVPPDSVFEEAIQHVNNTKKKKRRKYLFLLLAFLGITSCGLLVYSGSNYVRKINQKVDTLEQAVREMENEENKKSLVTNKYDENQDKVEKSNNNAQSKSTQTNSKSQDQNSITITEDKSNSGKKIVNQKLDNKVIKSDFNTNHTNAENSKLKAGLAKKQTGNLTESQSINNIYSSKSGMVTSDIMDDEEINKAASNDPAIITSQIVKTKPGENTHGSESPFVSIAGANSNNTTALIIPLQNRMKLIEHPNSNDLHIHSVSVKSDIQEDIIPGMAIGLMAGNNFSSFSMKNVHGASGIQLLDYDKPYQGYGLSIQFDYPIAKRWSIVASAAYHKIRNESTLEKEIFYDKNNESTNGTGESRYTTDMEIENPMGLHRSVINFKVNPEEVENMDIIEQLSKIKQEMSILNASIGIKYYPIRRNKFSVYSGTGVGYNHINQLQNLFNTELFLDQKMMLKSEDKTESMEKSNSNYYSIYVDLGAEYQISQKWSVNVATQFNRSITSLRYQAVSSDPQTFLNQIVIGAGIKFHF
jgi:outer membrane protein W